jgi:acetyl-CoA carboxylase biotin carboxyl carrier protein
VIAPAAALPPMAWAPAPAAPGAAPSGGPPAAQVPDDEHPGLVTSPMVGVAYLSPEPGQAA